MPIDLSFSQLLAVMAQVERYALSGGLVIVRPEASARLVFDRGVLLHAEMTRLRGRTTKGPVVLDDLIGRHQGILEWEWPGEREEAPTATVTKKDTSIFRRSLKMLVRYGYFDDPQISPVAADFFGVPEEALVEAPAPKPKAVVKNAVAKSVASKAALPSEAAEVESAHAPTEVESNEVEAEDEEDVFAELPKSKSKEKSASRSVIANPQTALGKLVFNKALRLGGQAQEGDEEESE